MSEHRRTIVIVGGTGGLGTALVGGFLRESAVRVIATGALQSEVDAAAAHPALSSADLRVLDVRDDDAVTALFASLDRLDVLINAAGVPAGPSDFTMEGFTRTIDINLLGTARACFAAQPLLHDASGTIINVASMMSFRGSATGPAYAASKGAIKLLTQSLAAAWGPRIRVNAIAPGFMDTPMTVAIQQDEPRNKRILDHVPAGRWGMPDDLVGAARFLASPEAHFVNGIVLPVDGGYLTT